MGPGLMNQPPMQGGPPMNYQQQPYGMNQQPNMDQSRYGSQGPPDQYGGPQSYHGGNTSHGNFPPRPPMMKNDQYPAYPGSQASQYGAQPMQSSMYSTPNKRYPDNRNDYMSPGGYRVTGVDDWVL